MKKSLITSLLALSLVAVASPVSAQGLNLRVRTEAEVKMENRNASSSERREDVKNKLEERRENMQERKASSTERRIELQQSIAKRLANHAKEMFTAMIERLEKLADRVQSRVEKVKASGGNTTESERFLAQARVHLTEARTSLATFLSVDLTAEKLMENFTRVRSAGQTVKMHLKEAHTDLISAIRALKVNGRATTTAEVEAN